MAKPTGAVCNLDCSYCFYLAKQQLYPEGDFRMGQDVLEAYLSGLFAAHAGADEVVVAFQGGEPTMMGLEFFTRVVEIEQRLTEPGQVVLNTLQTNATLLDDEWAAFLGQHGFLVGVSVDGPRELHDAFRPDRGGNPSFDRVMAGLAALRRHNVEWNALTTVNAANAAHGAKVYRFLRDELDARFIQFIPIVERLAGPGRHLGVSPQSVLADAYGRFMIEVFDAWLAGDIGRVYVQAFDTALGHWLGLSDAGLCIHEPTCGRSLALEHNGDVYSCDHFVDLGHRLGNIVDPGDGRPLLQIVDSPQQRAFGQAKRDSLPRQCRACEMLFACNGGCPKDRFITTTDGEPGLNYLCSGYLAFFQHIDPAMQAMAAAVRSGRDPASAVRDLLAGRRPPPPREA